MMEDNKILQRNDKNHSSNDVIHFNKRLIDSLNSIFKMPLTIISAPIGYGKTTALRTYLYRTNATVLWTNIYENSIEEFWKIFCKALSSCSGEALLKLTDIGFPYGKEATLQAIKVIDDICFDSETVLVIEDYHILNSDGITAFIVSLAKMAFSNFHVVITTRKNFYIDDELLLGGYVNLISSRVFALDEAETERFFKRYSISLGDGELKSIAQYTEGWISALNTIAITVLHNEKFDFKAVASYDSEITSSIRKLVYEPLPAEYKKFLCCMCYLKDISIEQADYVWSAFSENTTAKQIFAFLIDKNIFTVYDEANNKYHIHNLFCKVVKMNFEMLPDEVAKQYMKRMGDWYVLEKSSNTALNYYYQADYFAGIYNILVKNDMEYYGREDIVMLIRCYKLCKAQITASDFSGMMMLASKMYLNNKLEIYNEIIIDLRENLQADKNISEDCKALFWAEYEVLMCLSDHNDLEAIKTHIFNAYRLCSKKSKISHRLDWVFGSPSVLFLYYQKAGTVNKLMVEFKKIIELYSQMTDCDLSQVVYLLEAEINFNRCKLNDAEIFLHCALRNSEKNKDYSIWIACCFLLARIAIAKGNLQKAFEIMSEARENIQQSGHLKLMNTIDICEGWLYLILKQPEKVSGWLYHKELAEEKVFNHVIPAVYMVNSVLLIENANYTEFISYSIDDSNTFYIHSRMIAVIYKKLCLSISFKNINLLDEAAAYLYDAVECALTDELYMPFVELEPWLTDILDMVTEDKYEQFITIVRENAKTFHHAICPALMQSNIENNAAGLTKREKEIAELAQSGLINRDIAEKLFISENTVKSALKLIFRKLGITSRKELIQN